MIGTSADVPYADPAVIPMSFSHVMTVLDISLTNLTDRTVQSIQVSAGSAIFATKSVVSFSDNSQSHSANVSSMSVALNGAPAGSVTARLVMFPVTLASGTVLKYTVQSRIQIYDYSYIVTQDAHSMCHYLPARGIRLV